MEEHWVTMHEAASLLRQEGINVSVSKISRLASKGTIQTDIDPLDERVKLVELNQLITLFKSSKRRRT